jgi:hypothetical protein
MLYWYANLYIVTNKQEKFYGILFLNVGGIKCKNCWDGRTGYHPQKVGDIMTLVVQTSLTNNLVFYFYNIRGRLQLTADSANYVGYCTSRSFRKWNLISFFFTFDFKIKIYTRVFDELLVNEWDSWFEWLKES